MRIFDFYKDVLNITEDELIDEAVKVTEIKFLKKGEYLFRTGEIPTHICFLMNGVLRGVMLDCNGKDITDCIVFRCGDSVMPDNDFTQPASITMEALTDSQIVCVSITTVLDLLERFPSVTETYRKLLLLSANTHRNLKIATYQYTAVQRYEWFLKEYPGLIDRISHKYIASLLNMTPVTLSKIRSFLKR